jgi:hypothetical protein
VALSQFLKRVRRSVTVVAVTPLIGDHVHVWPASITSSAGKSNCRRPHVEQWQLNAAAHFNEWANLRANDFFPVVDAYKAPVKQFHCDYCHSIVAVTPDHGCVIRAMTDRIPN